VNPVVRPSGIELKADDMTDKISFPPASPAQHGIFGALRTPCSIFKLGQRRGPGQNAMLLWAGRRKFSVYWAESDGTRDFRAASKVEMGFNARF